MESYHECAIGEIEQDELFTFRLSVVLTYITPTLKREFEFQRVSELNPKEPLHHVQPMGGKHPQNTRYLWQADRWF